MSAFLSIEQAGSNGLTAPPAGFKPEASVYGARVKRMRATFTLASQATTDTLVLGVLPIGATFLAGIINTDTSLGSSTLAIGNASSTGKYRAAAVFTATNTPTLFGPAAAEGAAAPDLSADEVVIGTIASAALPSSGNLVIDILYSMP